jgi:hypothetical protein
VAAAFACLAAGLAASGATTPADAVNAKEIGKTRQTPDPSCPTPSGNDFPPRKGCQALGEVTGFQKKADGRQGLMRVPKNGHIVGWAVDLAKPNKKERNFFEDVLGNEAFGGAPSARLAMLTRSTKKKYRLRAQSPNVKFNGLMGRRQYFTLRRPIPVKKDWIAAITTFTWIPAFAHDLDNDDRWKASRTRKRCEGTRNLTKRSRPHKGVGSTRAYGCTYKHARIIYWAYFVPNN